MKSRLALLRLICIHCFTSLLLMYEALLLGYDREAMAGSKYTAPVYVTLKSLLLAAVSSLRAPHGGHR